MQQNRILRLHRIIVGVHIFIYMFRSIDTPSDGDTRKDCYQDPQCLIEQTTLLRALYLQAKIAVNGIVNWYSHPGNCMRYLK